MRDELVENDHQLRVISNELKQKQTSVAHLGKEKSEIKAQLEILTRELKQIQEAEEHDKEIVNKLQEKQN